MNFKIVYYGSGDELPFSAVHSDLVYGYINELNEYDINDFALFSSHDQTVKQKIENLQSTLESINEFVHLYLGKQIEERDQSGILDQAYLNKLHADWANSHEIIFNIDKMRKHPDDNVRKEFELIHNLFSDDIRDVTLSNVLARRGTLDVYEALNSGIHELESSFKRIMYDAVIPPEQHYIKINNPFSDDVISNNICNLKLSYYVKGRTLYDKFINFDMDLEYDDLNNHSEQSTRLEIDLCQPQTMSLSDEYVTWCKHHGMKPTGDFVNLGNLVNIRDNITKYRQVVYKNLTDRNHCSLVLGE